MKIVKTRKNYKVVIQEEIAFKVKTRKQAEKIVAWWIRYMSLDFNFPRK